MGYALPAGTAGKLPSFVAPHRRSGYNGAGALDRSPGRFNRKAARIFMRGRIFCGNRCPPPTGSGTGFFRKVVYSAARREADERVD
jgi:hypothetical protein